MSANFSENAPENASASAHHVTPDSSMANAALPVSANDGGTGNPDRARIRQLSALLPMLPPSSQNTRKGAFRTGTNATHSNSKSQSARQTSHTFLATGKSTPTRLCQRSNSGMNSCFLKYACERTTCEKSAQAISRSSRTVSMVCATFATISSEFKVSPFGQTEAVHEMCMRRHPAASTYAARLNLGP